MENHDLRELEWRVTFIEAQLDTYSRWLKRLFKLSLLGLLMYGGYKYAYRIGWVDAIEAANQYLSSVKSQAAQHDKLENSL